MCVGHLLQQRKGIDVKWYGTVTLQVCRSGTVLLQNLGILWYFRYLEVVKDHMVSSVYHSDLFIFYYKEKLLAPNNQVLYSSKILESCCYLISFYSTTSFSFSWKSNLFLIYSFSRMLLTSTTRFLSASRRSIWTKLRPFH